MAITISDIINWFKTPLNSRTQGAYNETGYLAGRISPVDLNACITYLFEYKFKAFYKNYMTYAYNKLVTGSFPPETGVSETYTLDFTQIGHFLALEGLSDRRMNLRSYLCDWFNKFKNDSQLNQEYKDFCRFYSENNINPQEDSNDELEKIEFYNKKMQLSNLKNIICSFVDKYNFDNITDISTLQTDLIKIDFYISNIDKKYYIDSLMIMINEFKKINLKNNPNISDKNLIDSLNSILFSYADKKRAMLFKYDIFSYIYNSSHGRDLYRYSFYNGSIPEIYNDVMCKYGSIFLTNVLISDYEVFYYGEFKNKLINEALNRQLKNGRPKLTLNIKKIYSKLDNFSITNGVDIQHGEKLKRFINTLISTIYITPNTEREMREGILRGFLQPAGFEENLVGIIETNHDDKSKNDNSNKVKTNEKNSIMWFKASDGKAQHLVSEEAKLINSRYYILIEPEEAEAYWSQHLTESARKNKDILPSNIIRLPVNMPETLELSTHIIEDVEEELFKKVKASIALMYGTDPHFGRRR